MWDAALTLDSATMYYCPTNMYYYSAFHSPSPSVCCIFETATSRRRCNSTTLCRPPDERVIIFEDMGVQQQSFTSGLSGGRDECMSRLQETKQVQISGV